MIVSGGQVMDFAPQALGETVPSLSNGYFYAQSGLALTGKFATYAALYRSQPSIATLVDKIANAAARLSLKVWDETPESGRVLDKSSGYAALLARPAETMPPFAFWRWTLSTYEVYGEAFWLKVRNPKTNAVVSLLPMHPTKTTVKRDVEGNVIYSFTLGVASAGILEVPESEVVPFLRYNPDSLMRGMSRLEPLRSTLLNEDASRRATAAWWQNGARPSVILKHPLELSDAAHRRIKASWEGNHAGADNMAKAAILEEGMDAQVVQLSAEELQYIESRKLNLQEVCMVYDVPPPVVHILDHATFSNITEQMRSMYRDTMAPRLEDIESVLDHFLRPDFFPSSTHAARFALDEVLRGDFETRSTAVGNLIEKGIMKPAEARPLFDLPDAGEIADHLYGNAALVPLGTSVHGQTEVSPTGVLEPSVAPANAPKPADPATVPSPGPAAASRALYRAVLGEVGRTKAAGGDERQVLVEEHRKALGRIFDGQRADVHRSVGAGRTPDGQGWDDILAGALSELGAATAHAIGSKVAKGLGGRFDAGQVADWIRSNAIDSAKAINATTIDQLKAALDGADDKGAAVDQFFDQTLNPRKESISAARVAMVGGLATLSAGSQSGAATKTWVTGANPRSAHAQMDGETVGIDDLFSNGMSGPGDMTGGVEQVAGCNCSLDFEF